MKSKTKGLPRSSSLFLESKYISRPRYRWAILRRCRRIRNANRSCPTAGRDRLHSRPCRRCGAPSNRGTISRTRPRRRLCGSGASRTGSTSAGPEVTLLPSTGSFDESAGHAGIRPTSCSAVYGSGSESPVLRSMMRIAEPKVRIHSPPAGSPVRTGFRARCDRRWRASRRLAWSFGADLGARISPARKRPRRGPATGARRRSRADRAPEMS